MSDSEPTLLDELKEELEELSKEPEIKKVRSLGSRGKANYPTREPLVADTPEQLVEVLGLEDSNHADARAGIIAFVSRNPGQAKKLPQAWRDYFNDNGIGITDGEWNTAINVGELIANHRFVKTPAAHREEAPPVVHVPVNARI